MKYLFTILVGVFLAPALGYAATAGTWQKGCQTGSMFATDTMSPMSQVCWTPTAIADDAPMLNMDNCENVDIFYFGDYAAAGGDGPADRAHCRSSRRGPPAAGRGTTEGARQGDRPTGGRHPGTRHDGQADPPAGGARASAGARRGPAPLKNAC